ncbi:MAG: response regulator transcription factor [Planctomycetales bacterium]|nr:response regulator transcription factor [Planctomycetales bacterium]
MTRIASDMRSHSALAPPTVYVLDGDPHYRATLQALLESVHLPVETYSSARDFLEDYDATRPGCLILEMRLPGMSGLELQRELSQQEDCLPIIVLTAYADVPSTVEAMKYGAQDFLEKPHQPQQLLEKVQWALQEDEDRCWRALNDAEITQRLQSLTAREIEIQNLLMVGSTAKQIARKLQISVRTVDFHRRNVLAKMQVENVVQLTHLLDEYLFRHPPYSRRYRK